MIDWRLHHQLIVEVRESGRVTSRAQVDAIDAALMLLRRRIHQLDGPEGLANA